MLIACLQQIERRVIDLRNNSASLVDQWRAYHLLQGRRIEIDTYNGRVQGVCLDIDDDGALLLETADGIRRFLGGIITSFDVR